MAYVRWVRFRIDPLSYRIKDFGSYTAGGRVAKVTTGNPHRVNFTRTASFDVDPRGHFAIEHAYVQYFIPDTRVDAPPVVLLHGGGMSGSCWDKTPDERPGWLHLLLAQGYAVHVVDNVERGRAGFAPGHWQGEPLLRSMEEAWTLFRIGPRDGFASRTPFEGQQFPVAQFDAFARQFVPRWLTTSRVQTDALLAVLDRTGPATVICHSQGAEIAFDAHRSDPSRFAALIALEPSGYPEDASVLQGTPTRILAGDYLDIDPTWIERRAAWRALATSDGVVFIETPEMGTGNSHMLMCDRNSGDILDIALAF
jgi:pimeloyl-ACP methyl ester carboxylesterase